MPGNRYVIEVPLKSLVTIESDEQIRAILQDHLETTGYQVRSFAHIHRFLEVAPSLSVDLILTGLLFDDRPCWPELEQLINGPSFKSTPVMVISSLRGSRFRTRAYSLSVRDYLEKPFNFKELTVRIAAILGAQSLERGGLSGSLRTCPFTEVAQIVCDSRKTGLLKVWHGDRNGTVSFNNGILTSATFATGEAETALEHMIGLQEGTFVFQSQAGDPPSESKAKKGPRLDLQRVVMETAWLEDELSIRRHRLPRPKDRLYPLEKTTPIPEPCKNQTTEATMALIQRRPGITFRDIAAQGPETELRRCWALALLIEHELITVTSVPECDPQHTPIAGPATCVGNSE